MGLSRTVFEAVGWAGTIGLDALDATGVEARNCWDIIDGEVEVEVEKEPGGGGEDFCRFEVDSF